MDMWCTGVLLVVLAPLRFLHFGKKKLLLISAMSLLLIAVEDLNREYFFLNLHSLCLFLILSKNLNLYKQKCQTPPLLVLTPQSTLWAPLRVLPTTILLLHHQALCILLSLFPFTLCLIRSSFLKRSLPSTEATKNKKT